MVFSKKKKPTEPGWWWVMYHGAVSIARVEYGKTRGFRARAAHAYQFEHVSSLPYLWGDRITEPTVEVSP